MARARELHPITEDIVRESKLKPPSTEPVPMYMIRAGMAAPKLVRRREIEVGNRLSYIIRARTNPKGEGRITLYETDYGDPNPRRRKVAEIETRTLQQAEDTFDRVVGVISQQTDVPVGVHRPTRPSPAGPGTPFVPEQPKHRQESLQQRVARQSMERMSESSAKAQKELERSVEELDRAAREEFQRAQEERRRQAIEAAERRA